MSSHLYEYKRQKGLGILTHKVNWMNKLEGLGRLKDIQITLLEECSADTVDAREVHWIEFYENKNLVNVSPGGGSHSQETVKKISDSKLGNKNPMFGHVVTEENRRKMVEGMRNSEKFKQSRQSEDYKKKISDAFSIPLVALDAEFNRIGEFKNCGECADHFGYKTANIKNAVRFNRPIGKRQGKTVWVVRKENLQDWLDNRDQFVADYRK